ncbi:MAG TPA: hypothetical protein VH619_03800 [Verrucomicrobiae bacterium]|jgi:hypothetical protein|nr:hypothetical protein [Verrucomicrobiae bacterium]
MEFLKRHYEKIVLCVVLLGLAAAAVWMKSAIDRVRENMVPLPQPPRKGAPVVPINLSTDELALAQVTNPPSITLSGDHNLFNPVTWKLKSDGTLLKVVKIGADALVVTKITKLYTIIGFDHASGQGSGVYVMTIQEHSDPQHPSHKTTEYAKKDEKMRSGLYIIRNVEGDPDNPTALELSLPDTGETVTVTKDKPYEKVDSYVADLRYDPESKIMSKVHVNDVITLDDVPYNVVEINANAVRVKSNRTTKVTEIKWK